MTVKKTPKTSDKWSYTHYPAREAYVVRPASGSAIYSFYYGGAFSRSDARRAARLIAAFRNAQAAGATSRQLLDRWHVISTLLPSNFDRLLLQLLDLIPDTCSEN
jgi:hypothetical protein